VSAYNISFQPDNVSITIPEAEHITIMEAAQRSGIILESACGGKGTCGKCLVAVSGVSQPVRACQYYIDRDLVVTIPQTSRFFVQKILQEGIKGTAQVEPMVGKRYLQLSPPTVDDLRSDAQRLSDAAPTGTVIDWRLLRQLPLVLRESDFKVTAVYHDRRIFALEGADTTDKLFGVGVDIGTTTVVASLVNLITGQTTAVSSDTNPQTAFGDDVISRIEYSRANPKGLQKLHRCIVDCLNGLIKELCTTSGVDYQNIYELTAAGNTTMQHLLLRLPVEQIAQAPYVAAVSTAVNLTADALGINIHPRGNIYVMPGIAAHVGGDTVAVALATAMRYSDGYNIVLDIGTNGEIVLGNKDRLFACSTAAGPAFEGARIRHGMRGCEGAIEHVRITADEIITSVIGGGPAAGICGSGLVDIIAELLDIGLIDPSGRLGGPDVRLSDLSPDTSARLIQVDNAPAFMLVPASQSRRSQAIVLTQGDIRQVQLATAAIRAGFKILRQKLGIKLEDINRLYLAGAFGNYIHPASARRMGLLPNLPLEKIQFVGNAASTGAKEVLLSRLARRHGEELAREIEYVELAGRSEFQEIFSDSLFFPRK